MPQGEVQSRDKPVRTTVEGPLGNAAESMIYWKARKPSLQRSQEAEELDILTVLRNNIGYKQGKKFFLSDGDIRIWWKQRVISPNIYLRENDHLQYLIIINTNKNNDKKI